MSVFSQKFICHICHRFFIRKSDLTDHYAVHSSEQSSTDDKGKIKPIHKPPSESLVDRIWRRRGH